MEITNYDKALTYVRGIKEEYSGWSNPHKVYIHCDRLEDLLMSIGSIEGRAEFNKLCSKYTAENSIDGILKVVEAILYY